MSNKKTLNIAFVYNKPSGTYITTQEILQKIDDIKTILCEDLEYYDINHLSGISFNPKYKKVIGKTLRKAGIYTMEFNVTFFENASLDSINNVIAHECIHLIPGCWSHKEKFKYVAEQLKNYGYEIERLIYDTNYGKIRMEARQKKIQYIPYCKTCGMKYKTYINHSKTLERLINGDPSYKCKCGKYTIGLVALYPDGTKEELR